ncbi:pre-rRNA-processing protein ESF2 [Cucumis melo var. makuwa]|uniref:Pre-rRNA-processing protein ESF2 n=1 Tax=Cucumis melo var. makuwa TaxID=1194695 RepID=A0A5A7T7P5_CUCMM|nr:pre-rRNA-processing protein ESF2 [Cucumis melo var. makuwa]TYK09343.1 pre-rRNA-processing protein ESF2 [Cucumis melo var. makuwa]
MKDLMAGLTLDFDEFIGIDFLSMYHTTIGELLVFGRVCEWSGRSLRWLGAIFPFQSRSLRGKARSLGSQGFMALQRPRGREDFREKLGDLYGSCDPRWCVAGDFNVIFDSPKEKASDGRITSSMRVFNKFIDDLLSLVRSILVLVVELQQGLIGSYSSRIGLIVRGKWEDYCFMGNLRALKGNCRVWNREVFENVNTRKKEITAGIEDTMSWSWKILWIVLWKGERNVLKGEFADLIRKESISWGQKVKVKWSREGECNGLVEKGEAFCSCIDWCPILTKEDEELVGPFTLEEIRKAVSERDRNKASGSPVFLASLLEEEDLDHFLWSSQFARRRGTMGYFRGLEKDLSFGSKWSKAGVVSVSLERQVLGLKEELGESNINSDSDKVKKKKKRKKSTQQRIEESSIKDEAGEYENRTETFMKEASPVSNSGSENFFEKRTIALEDAENERTDNILRENSDRKILESDNGKVDRRKIKRKKQLLKEAANADMRGICYLSRVPPHMDPLRLRQILSQYGEIQRIYLAPEDAASQVQRKRAGGFRGQFFSEGWVEFTDKRVAKKVANMLNGEPIGGRKRSSFYYDLWNIKYLSKFKWDDLTEETAYKHAIREQKLALEISAAKRERDSYLAKVDKSRALNSIEERLKKKQKLREDSEMNSLDDSQKLPKLIRSFPQTQPVADVAVQNKQRLSTNVLARVEFSMIIKMVKSDF